MKRSYGWSALGLPFAIFYLIAFFSPQALFLSYSFYKIGRDGQDWHRPNP